MMRAALIVLALALPRLASAETVAYAISIGNNAPPPTIEGASLAPLRYADDDAVRFHRLLTRFTRRAVLMSTLDEETQRRYPGLAATTVRPTMPELMTTVAQLKEAMALDRQRGDRPVLYFTFSGHGAVAEDGAAYLALEDGRMTQQALYEHVIDALPAQEVHLIIDACHAGGVVGVRGPGFGREVSAQTEKVTTNDALPFLEKKTLGSRPHVGALVATTLGEEAHEWSRFEGGVFSHEVLSALAGAADVNGDRKIEYTEVEAFVIAANRDIRDANVMPRVVARAPAQNRNAALVDLDAFRDVTVLKGAVSKLGHFFIELDTGERYLDAHLTNESRVIIAIPSGRTAYVRSAVAEAQVLTQGKPIELAELRFTPRAFTTRGNADVAYRTALFASPYGATYYRGFVDSTNALGVTWQQVRVVVVPSQTRPRSTTLPKVFLGGALAGGTVALVGAVMMIRAATNLDHATTQRDAQSSSDRYAFWSRVTGVSSLLAISSSLAAYKLWPSETTLSATPSRGGGVLSISGAF